MDSVAKGELLLKAEGIANIHKDLALTGQSAAPDATEPVLFHFISLVHLDGALYELGQQEGNIFDFFLVVNFSCKFQTAQSPSPSTTEKPLLTLSLRFVQ